MSSHRPIVITGTTSEYLEFCHVLEAREDSFRRINLGHWESVIGLRGASIFLYGSYRDHPRWNEIASHIYGWNDINEIDDDGLRWLSEEIKREKPTHKDSLSVQPEDTP